MVYVTAWWRSNSWMFSWVSNGSVNSSQGSAGHPVGCHTVPLQLSWGCCNMGEEVFAQDILKSWCCQICMIIWSLWHLAGALSTEVPDKFRAIYFRVSVHQRCDFTRSYKMSYGILKWTLEVHALFKPEEWRFMEKGRKNWYKLNGRVPRIWMQWQNASDDSLHLGSLSEILKMFKCFHLWKTVIGIDRFW